MVAAACSYPNHDDHGDDDQNDLEDQDGRDIGKWGCLGGLLLWGGQGSVLPSASPSSLPIAFLPIKSQLTAI